MGEILSKPITYAVSANTMFLVTYVFDFYVFTIKGEKKPTSPSTPPPIHTIKKPDINYLLFCRRESALLLKGVIYPFA